MTTSRHYYEKQKEKKGNKPKIDHIMDKHKQSRQALWQLKVFVCKDLVSNVENKQ